jgi:hypothetical protein
VKADKLDTLIQWLNTNDVLFQEEETVTDFNPVPTCNSIAVEAECTVTTNPPDNYSNPSPPIVFEADWDLEESLKQLLGDI